MDGTVMLARVRDVTVRLTVGQALVRWLQAQYSERDGERRRAIPALWAIFGHGNALGLGGALPQDGLPLYTPRHEQAMVHAAIGYAKAARRTQALACTASIGPGAANLLTGAATATVNRLPVLLLPADTFATRRSGVVLQELEPPGDVTVNDAFRPLSRFFDRVARPEQLLSALPAALRVLLDPAETGAVTVALHQDVLGEAYDWPAEFFEPRTWIISRRPPAAEELDAAAELLRAAERPLIIAGGGIRYSEAEQALAEFAQATGIPVAETSAGKGVAGHHSLGGIGVNGARRANQAAAQADVVIAAGTRLTDFTTASLSLFANARILGINVCAADAHKLAATPLVADARLALEALRPRVKPRVVKMTAADPPAPRGDGFTRAQVYATVNAAARAGDWVVAAAGWAPGDLLKLWTVPPGGHAHLEFGFSCMGHELPAALGIRMHEGPDPEIHVIIGDGSFLMAPAELATAVQHNLRATIIVLDNGGYGSIGALAGDTSAGNRFTVPTDFAALATAFGCTGVRAANAGELARALAEARDSDSTTLIHCPTVDGEIPASGAFWDLGVPEPRRQRAPRQRRVV
jgi:3D-(3,5/4)-trihydroxycyclohexane-1,2-dione acylhydrolase (decyclizing)